MSDFDMYRLIASTPVQMHVSFKKITGMTPPNIRKTMSKKRHDAHHCDVVMYSTILVQVCEMRNEKEKRQYDDNTMLDRTRIMRLRNDHCRSKKEKEEKNNDYFFAL